MTDEAREWYTPVQVAELLQVNKETVRRWIRSGELNVLNVGSEVRPDYRIRRDDLTAFIQRRYGPAGKETAAA